MIINYAQVQMQAQYESVSIRKESLNVQIWTPPDTIDNEISVEISAQGLSAAAMSETQQVEVVRKNLEFEISLLKQILERLTGKKIDFYRPQEMSDSQTIDTETTSITALAEAQFGLSIDYSLSSYESESVNFEAVAQVNTADGRQIEINLSFQYSREIETSSQFSLRMGQALKDPLVLNFSGSSLEFSNNRFDFDLDVDGELDRLPIFSSDTAFLALDNNLDGIINDGSELFGALSGDGFSDLQQYDLDRNQWIDENDEVFSRLKLYRPGIDGQNQLISLSEQGVGALYLGNLTTPFQLRDETSQNLNAELKSSGLYLTESGQSGHMFQIDLAI